MSETELLEGYEHVKDLEEIHYVARENMLFLEDVLPVWKLIDSFDMGKLAEIDDDLRKVHVKFDQVVIGDISPPWVFDLFLLKWMKLRRIQMSYIPGDAMSPEVIYTRSSVGKPTDEDYVCPGLHDYIANWLKRVKEKQEQSKKND